MRHCQKAKSCALSIAAILAIEACATTRASSQATAKAGQAESQEPYFNEINPEHPPMDGLWMPWSDARRFVHDQRLAMIAKLEVERDRDIARAREDNANKMLQQVQSPASSFWLAWAFPIGLVVGIAAGVGAAIAAAKGAK